MLNDPQIINFQENITKTIKFPPDFQNAMLINFPQRSFHQVSQISGVPICYDPSGCSSSTGEF